MLPRLYRRPPEPAFVPDRPLLADCSLSRRRCERVLCCHEPSRHDCPVRSKASLRSAKRAPKLEAMTSSVFSATPPCSSQIRGSRRCSISPSQSATRRRPMRKNLSSWRAWRAVPVICTLARFVDRRLLSGSYSARLLEKSVPRGGSADPERRNRQHGSSNGLALQGC